MIIKFNAANMNNAAKRIQNFKKKNNRLPNTLTIVDTNKKKRILTKKQYSGLFQNQYIFWVKNNRQPKTTSLLYNSNIPLTMNYQNLKTTCGPTSSSMGSMILYKYISESEFAKLMKTNHNGTSPQNLINGAKKAGFKLKKITRTTNAVKNSIKKGFPIIAHIETGGASRPNCLGYQKNYGHYVCIYGIKGNFVTGYKYLVADPSRGMKTCPASQINKATNKRMIDFYEMSLL